MARNPHQVLYIGLMVKISTRLLGVLHQYKQTILIIHPSKQQQKCARWNKKRNIRTGGAPQETQPQVRGFQNYFQRSKLNSVAEIQM